MQHQILFLHILSFVLIFYLPLIFPHINVRLCVYKYRTSCNCCPVSQLIVRWQRLSWIHCIKCQNSLGYSFQVSIWQIHLYELWKFLSIVWNCQFMWNVKILEMPVIFNIFQNCPKMLRWSIIVGNSTDCWKWFKSSTMLSIIQIDRIVKNILNCQNTPNLSQIFIILTK